MKCEFIYYLKIVQAMDDFMESKTERIIYGDATQYHLLKELAIAYTSTENCLALVGFINSSLPEKAYFEGMELLINVDDRDNVKYYCVKNEKLQILEHSTICFSLQETSKRGIC